MLDAMIKGSTSEKTSQLPEVLLIYNFIPPTIGQRNTDFAKINTVHEIVYFGVNVLFSSKYIIIYTHLPSTANSNFTCQQQLKDRWEWV